MDENKKIFIGLIVLAIVVVGLAIVSSLLLTENKDLESVIIQKETKIQELKAQVSKLEKSGTEDREKAETCRLDLQETEGQLTEIHAFMVALSGPLGEIVRLADCQYECGGDNYNCCDVVPTLLDKRDGLAKLWKALKLLVLGYTQESNGNGK